MAVEAMLAPAFLTSQGLGADEDAVLPCGFGSSGSADDEDSGDGSESAGEVAFCAPD